MVLKSIPYLQQAWQWLRAPSRIWIPFLLAALFFANASIQFNNRIGLEDWKSDLRADAGGYYIYLPGTIHHGMKAATVSDSMLWKGGNGFQLDRTKDRILTKYTYGTALMQLPFYLTAEAIEGFGVTDGWTRTHHRAIEVGAVLYWAAGSLLLLLALRRWRPSTTGVALIVLACVAFGTNSFYYAFRSASYSHVYSYFLVALALYAIHADRSGPISVLRLRAFQVACALLVVVRPIDGLAVLALYALLYFQRPELFRSWRTYFDQALIALIAVLPQLLYWRYVHGSWLVYSYGDERFTNLATPLFDLVLLSPQNGLLPYSPAFFLLPVALVFLFVQRWRVALVLTVMFALLIYSFAAWHAWHFGCGYGMRPSVEYTPFLGVALWWMFDTVHRRWPAIFHGVFPLVAIVCFVNYRSMLNYGGCFVAEHWDWIPYGRNLVESFFGKLPI